MTSSVYDVFVMVFIPLMMVLCQMLRPSSAQGGVFRQSNNVDEIMQVIFGNPPEDRPLVLDTRISTAGPTSCTTPNHGTGQCVRLSQCPIYMHLIKDVRDNAVSKFLRSIICRFEVNNVLICCPNAASSSSSRPQSSRPTSGGFVQPQPPSQNSQSVQINFGGSSSNNPHNLPISPTRNRTVINIPSQPPPQTTTTFPRISLQTESGPFIQTTQNRNPSTQVTQIQMPQGIPNQPPISLPPQNSPILPPQNLPVQPTQVASTQEPHVDVSFPPSALQPDHQQQEESPTTSATLASLSNIIPPENECGKTTFISINSASRNWPWLAAVGFLFDGGRFEVVCGGALVTRRHVITAAHCINFRKLGKPTHVRLGDYDLGRSNDVASPQDFPIAGYTTPGYEGDTFVKDIAIITFSQDVIFNDFIQPVCLPYRFRYDGFRYQNLSVIGWGQTLTSNGKDDLPQTPQVLETPVIGLEQCLGTYRQTSNSLVIDRRNLCAAGGSQEICLRDTGAPALYLDEDTTQRYFLAGLASFGFGCDRPTEPLVYTRIGAYLNWIEQNVK